MYWQLLYSATDAKLNDKCFSFLDVGRYGVSTREQVPHMTQGHLMASNAGHAGSTAPTPMTEHELKKLERETVVKLAEVLPVWYQALGPGLDPVFAGLGLLLKAVDEVAVATERSNAPELEIRAAAVRTLASNLAVPKLRNGRAQQAARLKALGGKQKAQSEMAYEAKTVRLIVEDFPAWYDEVGFSGFLGSLLEVVKVFGEVFHGYLDDESVERDKVFFLTAFEIRRRLNKIPENVLGALEMLAQIETGVKAAA